MRWNVLKIGFKSITIHLITKNIFLDNRRMNFWSKRKNFFFMKNRNFLRFFFFFCQKVDFCPFSFQAETFFSKCHSMPQTCPIEFKIDSKCPLSTLDDFTYPHELSTTHNGFSVTKNVRGGKISPYGHFVATYSIETFYKFRKSKTKIRYPTL